MGYGLWGLGPNPQSPIPNPPIPNPHINISLNNKIKFIKKYYFLINKKLIEKNIINKK